MANDPRSQVAEENLTGMHGPSPVLAPDGSDARQYLSLRERPELAEEIARPELIGVRAFWDQSIATGLTPERMGSVLRNAVRGDHRAFLQLAEEMEERDGHYYSVLSTRKRALSRLRAIAEPASEKSIDKKVADAVHTLVREPKFRDMLRDLTDAFGKGYSAIEIVWGEKDGMFWPLAYKWRDPKFFTFDYISRSELRLAELGTIDGVALKPAKFIVHFPKLKSGIPIRAGFARIAAWAWMFKTYSLKDWMAFLDVFGMPIRVGKYHPSASAEERRKLLQAVSSIAIDAAGIIPETMSIEFLEAKIASSDVPFENLGRYMDEQLSKVILGQTMTTDHGSSKAQAKVHNQIRIDILEDDADQMAATINRDLIDWFVNFNFGADAPRPYVLFPVTEPEDMAALSNTLNALVPLGLKVSMKEVRSRTGFSEPEDGEELLAPAPAALPASGAKTPEQLDRAWNSHRPGCPCGCGQRAALNASEEPIDKVDQIGADAAAEWEPQMSPIIEAVLKAAKIARSFEEFQAALDILHNKLDIDPLAERLAIAGLKARGLGDMGER